MVVCDTLPDLRLQYNCVSIDNLQTLLNSAFKNITKHNNENIPSTFSFTILLFLTSLFLTF